MSAASVGNSISLRLGLQSVTNAHRKHRRIDHRPNDRSIEQRRFPPQDGYKQERQIGFDAHPHIVRQI